MNRANVQKIVNDWDSIKEAIIDTVYLLNDLGFNGENINSYNSIIPIVYYRYKVGKSAFKDSDANEIRKYLVIAHLNQIFGKSTNTVLKVLRDEIDKHLKNETFKLAWFQSCKFSGDRTLKCTEDTITDWFKDFEKGPQTFMVLSLLYPNLKYGQVGFHQDHMYPYSVFDKKDELKKLVLPDGTSPDDAKIKDWKHKRNTLANLQLIEGRTNQEKTDMPLEKWLSDPKNKETVKYLPKNVEPLLENFDVFLEERKKLMMHDLKEILMTADNKI